MLLQRQCQSHQHHGASGLEHLQQATACSMLKSSLFVSSIACVHLCICSIKGFKVVYYPILVLMLYLLYSSPWPIVLTNFTRLQA